MSVAANLACIKEVIGDAPVTLIAVTKTVGLEQIAEAFQCGITEFGENRVQDALEKQKQLPAYMADKVRWHLIGHLQTNKVKKAVGKFCLIHSVDSWNLAQEISDQAVKQQMKQPVLLQVKVLEGPGKSGFDPQQLKDVFPRLMQLPGITIEGLMTMAPLSADRLQWRECFRGLRQLKAALESAHAIRLEHLSMGMTQDFEEAVRCGSTMIRLGRAVFGETVAEGGPKRPS
jgi:PLP dependent protein